MKRLLLWVGASFLVCGCATATPPAPPVAVAVPHPPAEFSFTNIKWAAGSVLAYRVVNFAEISLGDQHQTKRAEFTMSYRAGETTPDGGMRVEILKDDSPLGYLLLDDQGRFVDAMASRKEAEGDVAVLAQGLDQPLLRKLSSMTLSLGTARKIPLPAKELERMAQAKLADSLVENVEMECVYTGQARLGDRVMARVEGRLPGVLLIPLTGPVRRGVSEAFRTATLTVSLTSYYDLNGAVVRAEYSTTTLSSSVGQVPLQLEVIQLKTLDTKASKGF